MKEEEIFSKNLILSTEFDRYVLEHPDFAEKIPQNAQIVLLPEDDPKLCKKTLKSQRLNVKKDNRLYMYILKRLLRRYHGW